MHPAGLFAQLDEGTMKIFAADQPLDYIPGRTGFHLVSPFPADCP
jgi:hypothetical protein